MYGTVQANSGSYQLRLEFQFQQAVERVWEAMTQPDALAEWLAHAELELVVGGKVQLRFANTGDVMNGTVTQVTAPHVFEFFWNSKDAEETPVRFALQHEGTGCRLTLTHTLARPTVLPEMMAGWHTHLEVLATALAGQAIAWPWGRWEELRDHYAQVCSEL